MTSTVDKPEKKRQIFKIVDQSKPGAGMRVLVALLTKEQNKRLTVVRLPSTTISKPS